MGGCKASDSRTNRWPYKPRFAGKIFFKI